MYLVGIQPERMRLQRATGLLRAALSVDPAAHAPPIYLILRDPQILAQSERGWEQLAAQKNN